MKLVALLRIKNQIQTIEECMAKLSEIVDEIIVVDNGSTDGTLEAYGRYPKIVSVLQTIGFDEGRDKVMAHEEAKKREPDWLVWIDADEVFEKHFTRAVAEKYMHSKYNRVTFRMCNFWLSRQDCRYDSEYYLYTLHPQRSMWRNIPSAYFKNVTIHNGDILGVPGAALISPYRLKHYGYVDKEKIAEKMNIYKTADPHGSRDYAKTGDLTRSYRTFRFREFDNIFLNRFYIAGYKYVCNFLWYAERVKRKITNLL